MKTVAVLLLALFLTGCAQSKRLDGVLFEPVGLAEEKHPCVAYEVSIGNVIWSVFLFQTIIVPVWLIGWDLYEPTAERYDNCLEDFRKNGQIDLRLGRG